MGKFGTRDVLPAHKAIMAALESGRIGPNGALRWARRAAAGEDLGWLAVLAPVAEIRASAPIMAHSNAAVLDILTRALTGDTGDTGDGSEELPNRSTVQYGDSLKGSIGDDEADTLFPPRSYAERDKQEATRQRLGKVRASAPDWWSEEDLHTHLFGDTTGKEAGG